MKMEYCVLRVRPSTDRMNKCIIVLQDLSDERHSYFLIFRLVYCLISWLKQKPVFSVDSEKFRERDRDKV